MTGFQKFTRLPAGLESFDPAAFEADQAVSQDVCNFVLTLALVHNDLKDLFLANTVLKRIKPDEPFSETPEWGEYNALALHITRLVAALIHELCQLIEKQSSVMEHKAFRKVLKQVSRRARDAWCALETVALGKDPTVELEKTLLLLRNKVAFHYDTKEVARGYKTVFVEPISPRDPYVSRGKGLEDSRFYFADAAVEAYLELKTGRTGIAALHQLINQVPQALFEIVTSFVQSRGFAWRPVRPNPSVSR